MRVAFRGLVRQPVLAVAVVSMLSVALAFAIASMAILNGLLVRPYGYPKLSQILLVRDSKPQEGAHQRRSIASGDFLDMRRGVPAFMNLAAWRPLPAVITNSRSDPERVEAIAVTANFFELLRVTPEAGRGFAIDADTAGHEDVVMLSRRLWSSRFGADPEIVGRSIGLNGRPVTVLGVVRDEDCYPPGVDAWTPMVFSSSEMTERATQRIAVVGRLAEGATQAGAATQLASLATVLAAGYPATNRGRGFDLLPLRREQYEFTAPLFLFVQAAALLVLTIAVVNVHTLLVARTIDRRRELSVRWMLGASTGRVAAVAMAEAGLLVWAAAFASVLLARPVLNGVRTSLPEGISRWIAGWSFLRVDALSIAAGIAFAAVAALAVCGAVAAATLRLISTRPDTARTTSRSTWGRRAIVGAEVGLAAGLLLAASVMVSGFARISAAFASFEPDGILRFTLTLPEARYPGGRPVAEFHRAVLGALRSLPEVENAALIRNQPASNVPNPILSFQRDDAPVLQASDAPRADIEVVSPALFETLRLAVVAGRALDDADGVDQPRVAVISREASRRFWPDRDPLGTMIRLEGEATPLRVVGIASDFILNWYEDVRRPVIFLADAQFPARTTSVLVRTRTTPMSIVRQVKAAVSRLDGRQPLAETEPLAASITDSLSPVRVIGQLLTIAAALSILLAAIGVYGVLAQWVGSRTRELGVRFALGATRWSIAGLVVGEALGAAGAGGLIGVGTTAAAVRVAGAALLGVPAVDARVVVLVSCGVTLFVIAAALGPARRAARVDVAELLRD